MSTLRRRLGDRISLGDAQSVHGLLAQGAQADAVHNGRSLLTLACLQGDTEIVAALLAHGARAEGRGTDDWPLAAAAELGKTGVVALLLQHGAAPWRPEPGFHPIRRAAAGGHGETLQVLLSHCAGSERAADAANKALLAAAEYGCNDAVTVALRHGADIDHVDEWGMTALKWSLARRHIELFEMLIAARADPNAGVQGQDELWHAASPLHIALGALDRDPYLYERSAPDTRHDKALVRALLDAGARVDAQAVGFAARREPACLELLSGADLNQARADGTTPLMEAVSAAQSDSVDWLIEAGVDLDARDGRGETALFKPIARIYEPVQAAIFRRLLSAGADPTIRDKRRCDPLNALLARYWHPPGEFVLLLLDHGVSAESRFAGRSALEHAAEWGHCEAGELLCRRLGESLRNSLLWWRCRFVRGARDGDADVLQRCLEERAPDQKSLDWALRFAVMQSHTACVERLLAAGADATNRFGDNTTILLVDALNCRTAEILDLLLRAGTHHDPHAPAIAQLLDLAELGGKENMRAVLAKYV